jgi:hypothetical protein
MRSNNLTRSGDERAPLRLGYTITLSLAAAACRGADLSVTGAGLRVIANGGCWVSAPGAGQVRHPRTRRLILRRLRGRIAPGPDAATAVVWSEARRAKPEQDAPE